VDEGAFVFVAGSTHAGEEQVVLDAYDRMRAADPNIRLVLVPRHPDRVRDVDGLLRARGQPSVHLSELPPGVEPGPGVRESVVVGDTMGELARLYGLADLVFVGGSLTKRGGQNMMEPCGLGRAVVVGPNTWNFRDPMEMLLTRDGILQVEDARTVVDTLVALHGDPERRERLGANARQVCLESKGATRRILDILREYVPRPVPGVENGPDRRTTDS
jgi:3-deoxy-D-manno-octulosonic-acid transferase